MTFLDNNTRSIGLSILNSAVVFFALLAVSGAFPGCSSDNKKATLHAAFVAENKEPFSNSVAMIEAEQKGVTFKFNVQAFAIDSAPVYAAAFDIDFDPEVIEYLAWEPGDFLERNATLVNYDAGVTPETPGKLVVGVSQQGTTTGTLGEGILITLQFKVLNTKLTPMIFSNNQLLDPTLKPVSGISWYGARAFGLMR